TMNYSWSSAGATPTTSSSTNPSFNYSVADTFAIDLIVTSSFGCTDTVTANAIVNPQPVAAFTSSPACAGAPLVFTNTSGGGATLNYAWTFPGGTPATSSSQNPSVTFSTLATLQVTLIASSSTTC